MSGWRSWKVRLHGFVVASSVASMVPSALGYVVIMGRGGGWPLFCRGFCDSDPVVLIWRLATGSFHTVGWVGNLPSMVGTCVGSALASPVPTCVASL